MKRDEHKNRTEEEERKKKQIYMKKKILLNWKIDVKIGANGFNFFFGGFIYIISYVVLILYANESKSRSDKCL